MCMRSVLKPALSRSTVFTCLSSVLLVGIVLALFQEGSRRPHVRSSDVAPVPTPAADTKPRFAAPSELPRVVFRHSVIPGGATTVEELRAAMDNDSVVAAHHAGVTLTAIGPQHLSTDHLVYMSYRIADAVYWTRQKVRLPQGETVLFDGSNYIRARCGNGISFEPRQPTSAQEPQSAEFDEVDDPAVLVASRVPAGVLLAPDGRLGNDVFPQTRPFGAAASGFDGGGIPLWPGDPELSIVSPDVFALTEAEVQQLPFVHRWPPPGEFPTAHDSDPVDAVGSTVPVETPVPAPEPGTLLLVGGGISAVLARRRLSRGRT
jgi:hypothetical protein